MNNTRHEYVGAYEVKEVPLSLSDLKAARHKAENLITTDDWQMRSCFLCNVAHAGFAGHDDLLMQCFECGRWYLGGIDITIYDEDEGL